MTTLETAISPEELTPRITSDIFDGSNANKHLAIGLVGVGEEALDNRSAEYEGYLRLRGNVYAYEKQFMPVDELNPDGTETDVEDERSVHFAVIENALHSPRVVGAMRLIVKSQDLAQPLPVEAHYSEVFKDQAAPIGSTEVSRLISRHESKRIQNQVKWLLLTAGVAYVNKHELGPVYGVVTAGLARGLSMEGTPVEALDEPRFIPEYNSTKLPIKIGVEGLTQKLQAERPELLEALSSMTGNVVYLGETAQEPAA